jgi:hypothetical protein
MFDQGCFHASTKETCFKNQKGQEENSQESATGELGQLSGMLSAGYASQDLPQLRFL